METATNKFHERYKGVTFEDDTPWYVWNDAWRECIEQCAIELERQAQATGDTAFFEVANAMRETNENHKQARLARNDRQCSEASNVF